MDNMYITYINYNSKINPNMFVLMDNTVNYHKYPVLACDKTPYCAYINRDHITVLKKRHVI